MQRITRDVNFGVSFVIMNAMEYEVIVKTDIADRPEDHELSAALILARHFKANVTFIRPLARKTPDIDVDGARWEIKSPRGNGKKTIDNNFRTARKQSKNIVLDLRRIKMHKTQAIARVSHYLSAGPHGLNRVLIITKTEDVIEIL